MRRFLTTNGDIYEIIQIYQQRYFLSIPCLSTSTSLFAQSYPAKAVTLVVPFAAGGPTDVTARLSLAPWQSLLVSTLGDETCR